MVRSRSLAAVALAAGLAAGLMIGAGRGLQQPEGTAGPNDAVLAQGQQLMAEQSYAEAAEKFKEFLATAPEHPDALFGAGYCLHMVGKIDEAIPYHEKAAQTRQFRQIGLYNLGCAWALKGEKDKAVGYLEQAFAAGMVSAEQYANDPDLKSLKGHPRFERLMVQVERGRLAQEFRQLDFWLGSWTVKDPAGTVLGTDRVTPAEGGYALLQHWQGPRLQGHSLTWYDTVEKKWRQTWVDSTGGSIVSTGTLVDGAMKFEGVHHYRNGNVRKNRTTLATTADGGVRYVIEESSDEGATWSPVFEGVYTSAEGTVEAGGSN